MNQHLTGLPAWLIQRLSAVYMGLYVVTLPLWFSLSDNYRHWHDQFSHPLIATATTLFCIALLMHSWIGVRDIILDYTGHKPALRLVLLAILGGTLIALAIRAAVILIRIST